MSRLPLIGVTDCSSQLGQHACYISGDNDTNAVAEAAVLIIPSLAFRQFPSDILDGRNGTPITVTPFNIEPIHHSGPAIVQRRRLRLCTPDFCSPAGQHDSLLQTRLSTRRRCVKQRLTFKGQTTQA